MSTNRLTLSALLMAMVIILSSSILSIPVPGGHFYLNGILICLVGLLFPPTEAMIVAGVGSFLGDFFFYPAPMFVTLITHSLQVLVISLIARQAFNKLSITRFSLALVLGEVVNLIGYFLGRTFIYANLVTAMTKLPFDILAGVLSIVLAGLIYYKTGFVKAFKERWSKN